MKVGYAVLYEDGELIISKNHTLLQKKIEKDYGIFEDTNVPWICNCKKIKIVQIFNQVKSNCMNSWFFHCSNLTTLMNFQNLNVSDCKDFSNLFYNCLSLRDILSLQYLDVSNGQNFQNMFYNCKSLIDISHLSNWDVFNGLDFSWMFNYCELLTNISVLSNWNVLNGKDFCSMFKDCVNLKEIHLTNTLKNLNWEMFDGCNPNLKIHWKEKIYTYEDLLEYQEF